MYKLYNNILSLIVNSNKYLTCQIITLLAIVKLCSKKQT